MGVHTPMRGAFSDLCSESTSVPVFARWMEVITFSEFALCPDAFGSCVELLESRAFRRSRFPGALRLVFPWIDRMMM